MIKQDQLTAALEWTKSEAYKLDTFRVLELVEITRMRLTDNVKLIDYIRQLPDELFNEYLALNRHLDLERRLILAEREAKAFKIPEITEKLELLAHNPTAQSELISMLSPETASKYDAYAKRLRAAQEIKANIEETKKEIAKAQDARNARIIQPCKLANGDISFQGVKYCASKLPAGWIPPAFKLALDLTKKGYAFKLVR